MKIKFAIIILASLSAFSITSQAIASVSSWPILQHDAQHTGKSPYLGPETSNVKWIFNIAGELSYAPAISSDGTIYLSAGNGLHAFNPDGTQKWLYATSSTTGTPAIDSQGTIYFFSQDSILAISPNNTLKWQNHLPVIYSSTTNPVINQDGKIYFIAGYAFPDSTNRLCLISITPQGVMNCLYQLAAEAPPSHAPQLTPPTISREGILYFGYNYQFFAIDSNGILKWKLDFPGYPITPATISSDNTIYVLAGGKFNAINQEGQILWSSPSEPPNLWSWFSTPAALSPAEDNIYVSGCYLRFGFSECALFSFDKQGIKQWARYLSAWPYSYFSAPIVDSQGTIYVVGDDNLMSFTSPGILNWSIKTGHNARSLSLGSNQTLYSPAYPQPGIPGLFAIGPAIPPVPTYGVAVILSEPANVPHDSSSMTAQPCKLLPEKTYPNGHDKEYYQDLAYCVADYHKENSFGTINLDFEIFDNNGDWFKTNKNEQDYLGKEDEFVIDAINLATSSSVDLSDKDIVIVIYSGEVYAHTWSLDSQPLGYPPYKIIIAEENLVGAWAHEVGHIIGAMATPENTIIPDLSRNDIPMGFVEQWDLMARGSWNDGGNNPPNMSSYTKEFLGWLKENIYPKSAYGEYWINSLETSKNGDPIFRYNLEDNINTSTQEYYILEVRNRNLKTWDSSLPGLPIVGDKHLVVYYIDTKGLSEYGYVTTSSIPYQGGMMWNQYRTVTIPGNNPKEVFETNDGILNHLINETYSDFDNLVKFTALTDRTVDEKYEIKSKIEEITNNSFGEKFWGVVLRPSSFFEQRIRAIPGIFNAGGDSVNQLGMPLREAPGAGVVRIIRFLFWCMAFLILLSILSFVLYKYKSKGVSGKTKIIFRFIWIITLVTIAAFTVSLFFKPVLIKRIEQSLPPFPEGVIPVSLPYATSPDLDLHLYCENGRHIGMNYETGGYEIQISEVIVSGDNQDAPEWIFIPPEITGCNFAVSSYDNQKFLLENPDIAQQMEDKMDSYEVYTRYIDPETAIYTSSVISETIKPGTELEHLIGGTADISIQEGIATIDTLRHEIKNALNLGPIDNRGVANSLLQKLDSAEKKINQKSFKSAKNTLNALKNEINAQKGKHITEDTTNILIEDLNTIIQSIVFNTNNSFSVLIADIQAIFTKLIGLLPKLISFLR